ncbi:hypothetical protein DWUX_2257 [Desulfovibrio diazotrophicus]|nr:hypothetical protein DWUX_2257 [Desulfovibrio diazotrophicus]
MHASAHKPPPLPPQPAPGKVCPLLKPFSLTPNALCGMVASRAAPAGRIQNPAADS